MVREPEGEVPEGIDLLLTIQSDQVRGTALNLNAIRLPDLSCDRGDKTTIQESQLRGLDRRGHTGVAAARTGALPKPIPRDDHPPLMFLAMDDPIEENEAYCEIRVCPEDRKWKRDYQIRSRTRRHEAKRRLAGCFRVVMPASGSGH